MITPKFIDIHVLQTVPYSNLNRDDVGAPKTVLYGGAERTRVSSQSWKRVIRAEVEKALGDKAVRTRRVVRGVADRLMAQGWSEVDAEAAGRQVARSAGNGIKLEKDKNEKDAEILVTSVLLFLPESGLDELTAIAAQHREAIVDAEAKKSPKGVLPSEPIVDILKRTSGGINLFGRMLAELPGANVDGAVQVAHAFTTHKTVVDYDFFTAVDDIELKAKIPGSAHMGTGMFSAGTFYRYANVDLAGLTENVGDDKTTRELVEQFLRAFITTLPTAKKTGTAPATVPDLVHLTVRGDRPVSYAPAFEAPVVARADSGHRAPSQARLSSYAGQLGALLGADGLLFGGHAGVIDDGKQLSALGERVDSFDGLLDRTATAAFPRGEA